MKSALKFEQSCVKTLTAVEVQPDRSNQHELNGISQLKSILGASRVTFEALFSVRGEDRFFPVNVTWYDARENHPSRSEYRLYFQSNPVMECAQEGSAMVLGKDSAGRFWCELIDGIKSPAS